MEVFATRLKLLLKEHGMSMYRLAKEIGVNKQTVIFWCNGTNEPKISYLKKIALYFDVSADYLLDINLKNPVYPSPTKS